MPRQLDPEARIDLKRMLLRLAALDDESVVAQDEGSPLLLLVRFSSENKALKVRNPVEVLQAFADGNWNLSAVKRTLNLERDPIEVTDRWLGAAQRDLKILARHPRLLALTRESPRTFGRFGTLDREWLDHCQQRIDALSSRRLDAPSSLQSLVDALHGPGSFAALAGWRRRSLTWSQLQRKQSRERLAALKAVLANQPVPPAGGLSTQYLRSTANRLLRTDRLRGRSFDRTIYRIVAETLAWPEPPRHGLDPDVTPLPRALCQAIDLVGTRLLAAVASTRRPDYVLRLDRALNLLALAHRPDGDGHLSPHDLGAVLRDFTPPYRAPAVPDLTFTQELELLRLKLSSYQFASAANLLRAGIDTNTLRAVIEQRRLDDLAILVDHPLAARVWLRWVLELAPQLEEKGIKLELTPEAFLRLSEGRTGSLALFSHGLMAAPDGGTPASRLAFLDTLLALTQSAPAQARHLQEELAGTTAGLGKQTFPDFAAWLTDDSALDRLFHLQRLAGESPHLPNVLLRDFQYINNLRREEQYLGTLETLTPRQQARLDRVRIQLTSARLPGPAWTQRRLAERLDTTLARALEIRLDGLLRESLRAGFGIAIQVLTPAWRDAVRFYLSTERNRNLLGTLLRHAAASPGVPLAPSLPANQEWLKHQPAGFSESWLAYRQLELTLSGKVYTLATENDPIEILRMGIPFGTCLSLDTGCNAAATVINALDVNKRVIYVRDRGGAIVARKLLAVGPNRTLLGYRLYLALESDAHPAVTNAVETLCQTIAQACGLTLGSTGVPDTIHDGFWYDDGTVPFGTPAPSSETALARFCEHLGRPVVPGVNLLQEARYWAAREDQEHSPPQRIEWHPEGFAITRERARRWVAQAGPDAAQLAVHDRTLSEALQSTAFEESPAELLRVLGTFPKVSHSDWETASSLLSQVDNARGLVQGLALLACRHMGRAEHFSDHGIEHGTAWAFPRLISRAPVAEALRALETVAPVWAYVVEQVSSCGDCIERATEACAEACLSTYANAPDPRAVLKCLADPRRPLPALRAALRIAARFPFSRVPESGDPIPWGLTLLEGKPRGCPAALRALRELRERRRELATNSDFLAAILRQSDEDKLPVLDALPVPDEAPFEALADLQLHWPELTAEILAPWASQLSSNPGPWEYYFHRRHETPWKRMLHRRGVGNKKATQTWLALLGEAEPERFPADFAPEHEPPKIPTNLLYQVRSAVFNQVSGKTVDLAGLPAPASDPANLRQILRTLVLALEDQNPEAIELTARFLSGFAGSTDWWKAVTQQLVRLGAPGDAVAAASNNWSQSLTWGLPEVCPKLAIQLLQIPQAAPALLERFGRLEPGAWQGWYDRLVAAARESGLQGDQAVEAVVLQWVRHWQSETRLFPPFEDGLAEHLFATSLALGVTAATNIYLRDADPTRASRFLDRLLQAISHSDFQVPPSPADPGEDIRGRWEWLVAALNQNHRRN